MQKTTDISRLHDRLRSFRYALRGLSQVLRKEINFRIHLAAAITAIALGVYFNISRNDWLVIILCIGLVMALEVVNSAVERLVDLVSPQKNEQAKRIKDMAAGAVLIAALCALIAGTFVFLPYFKTVLRQ